MPSTPAFPSLDSLFGQIVVLDLSSPYVCIGRLVAADDLLYQLLDADLHDFRDSPITRENYVYDSVRLGIRRNRKQVLVRRSEVVAITRFADISET
ncbi:MAG: hypothetical protein JWN86_1502 [Planctomycetota bacterium]|nr:hypothetical protein [Planctomycetota bacterium]